MTVPTQGRIAVAAPHAAAISAAHDAVARGGNAVDAAVAAAMTLSVVYPHQCSVGGDLFALLGRPDGSTVSVNASGAHGSAPGAVPTSVSVTGPRAVTVPGAVSGWARLLDLGGALPAAALLEGAAGLADEGVPVSPGLAAAIEELVAAGSADDELLRLVTEAGASGVLRQPALARTLRSLAGHGLTSLYDGPVADELAHGFEELGVPVTRADLGEHTVIEESPWSCETSAMRVLTSPPNSQGYLLLAMLAACERLGDHLSVDAATLARLFARAESCRLSELADPRHVRLPKPELLSPDRLLDGDAVRSAPLPAAGGDTVAVTAVSSDGTAVSLIQSVFHSFGAQLIEARTGVILHNRGSMFSADPASPNHPAPGKRPAHTLMPVIVEHADGRLSAYGAMGGRAQPQIHLQLLRGTLAGLGPQEAVSAPRFVVREGVVPAEPEHTRHVGHAMICTLAPDGTLSTGIDPRSDGMAPQSH
jgi:gamma-glutamyltranspeptidase/glutathione hydrolase